VKLEDVVSTLQAKILCGDTRLDMEIADVCGADLMSDVLCFTKHHTLLLTGLTTMQAIRTAEISDLAGIVFVRGKYPAAEVVLLAKEKKIPLFVTHATMYEACGQLYCLGLNGCGEKSKDEY
jgi:predicted transcriptional regulator